MGLLVDQGVGQGFVAIAHVAVIVRGAVHIHFNVFFLEVACFVAAIGRWQELGLPLRTLVFEEVDVGKIKLIQVHFHGALLARKGRQGFLGIRAEEGFAHEFEVFLELSIRQRTQAPLSRSRAMGSARSMA